MLIDKLEAAAATPLDELEQVERALTAGPESIASLDWLAFMFLTHRQYERAERYYRRLVELAPSGASYRYWLGDTLAARGDPLAADQFRQVMALEPDGEYAHLAAERLARAGS